MSPIATFQSCGSSSERHVADRDVPELRQLVHLQGAEEASDRSHPSISGFGQLSTTGVRPHRSELE